MKRMLVCFFIGLFILSGCQFVAAANRQGSIETKKAVSLDNNELSNTATLPGFLPSIIDTPTHFQNPAITDESTDEDKQTPDVQANNQTLTSSAYLLSINNARTPTRKETIIPLTSTPTGNYIELINISDRRIGKATVFWRMHGDTVNSFRVVYSETNPNPTYPNDKYEYGQNTGSPYAETAFIYGTPGHTYYVRVCEYTDIELDGCINYTNTVQFTFNIATITPSKTISNNLITLGVGSVGEGTARVTWYTQKDYPNGFEIIWSSVVTMPDYPYNNSIHANNSDRSIVVYGEPGTRYYYRICGYIGNVCDDYSASIEYIYSYKAPAFTPTPSPTPTIVLWTLTETKGMPIETEIVPIETPIPTKINTEIPIVAEPTDGPTEEPTEVLVETSEE
jgi:hypothetical protein